MDQNQVKKRSKSISRLVRNKSHTVSESIKNFGMNKLVSLKNSESALNQDHQFDNLSGYSSRIRANSLPSKPASPYRNNSTRSWQSSLKSSESASSDMDVVEDEIKQNVEDSSTKIYTEVIIPPLPSSADVAARPSNVVSDMESILITGGVNKYTFMQSASCISQVQNHDLHNQDRAPDNLATSILGVISDDKEIEWVV